MLTDRSQRWRDRRSLFVAGDSVIDRIVRVLATFDRERRVLSATEIAGEPLAIDVLRIEGGRIATEHLLAQGARRLHLVDLNGAFAGKPQNLAAIKSILNAVDDEIPVQLGGGIRNRESVERWFDLGVARIVIGTAALTDPQLVAPMFTGLFMDKMVGFLKNYFPVFLLGAVFGKVIELSGFSRSIVAGSIRLLGESRAILSIVTVCALLTYGGVSLFVVVFAVYPFAAELFRQSGIPKRLIPGTIALGAFTFTMDALPGTPQIQNIIPTTFFGTDGWAAPVLGIAGSIFILIVGLTYLEWRRRQAKNAGEGYGDPATLVNEPETPSDTSLSHPLIALLPLIVVGVVNKLLTQWIPEYYGKETSFIPARKPT